MGEANRRQKSGSGSAPQVSFARIVADKARRMKATLPALRHVGDLIVVRLAETLPTMQRYSIDARALTDLPQANSNDMVAAVQSVRIPETGIWLEFHAPDLPIPGTAARSGIVLTPEPDVAADAFRIVMISQLLDGRLAVSQACVTVRPTGDTRPADRSPTQWAARRSQILSSPAVLSLPSDERSAAVELLDRLQLGMLGVTVAPGEQLLPQEDVELAGELARMAIAVVHALQTAVLSAEPSDGSSEDLRAAVLLPTTVA
jgi:hypothetical protein